MARAQEEKRRKGVLRLPLLDLMSGRLANVAVAKSEHGASPLPHQHHCCSFTWEAAKLKCRSLAWGATKSVWYKKSFSAKIKNSFKKVLKKFSKYVCATQARRRI
jgi:hypothetical protein